MLYVNIVKTIPVETMWFNFENYFWQGGLDTVKQLTFKEFEKCMQYLIDTSDSNVIEQIEINDFFWFEDEKIEEITGRKIWED